MQAILAHLGEELLISWQLSVCAHVLSALAASTLLAPEQADEQDAGTVDCKQGADGVELGSENLQHDEGKGELADGCAHVGAFKRPLCCADLNQLGTSQDN